MSYSIRIITTDGKLSHADQGCDCYFYAEKETMKNYPVWRSGKRKGDISFKCDGTLLISDTLFEKIKGQNGYLMDGKKNVHVNFPHGLRITYKTTKFYLGYFIEEIKKTIDRYASNHLHSLEGVMENYNKYYPLWQRILSSSSLDVVVTPNSGYYNTFEIEGFYFEGSWYQDQLVKEFQITDRLDFKAPVKDVLESYFEYDENFSKVVNDE